MTYKINNKEVSVNTFADTLVLKIINELDNFSAMNNDDLLTCESSFNEIAEYVDNIKEQIQEAKDYQEKEQELEDEHVRIERAALRG